MSAQVEIAHIALLLLVPNCVLSLLYGLVNKVRRKPAGMTFFFFFLPWLGFAIYFIPIWGRRFIEAAGVNREAVLTHVFDIERPPEHPDIEESLRVVPIEDAMAISDKSEKRALLLNQLQKDLQENYRALLVASEDEDSESAHYIAAAKMEIYRLHQAHWLERRRDYEEDPDDPETFHLAFNALDDMLKSGVLSDREQHSYLKRLCELVQRKLDSDAREVTLEELEEYLDALIQLECYEDAKLLWEEQAEKLRSEQSYHSMLKMYYQLGDAAMLRSILDDLRGNRQIRLSTEGLQRLRYWMGRLDEVATQDSLGVVVGG